jgi:hypothetical protein
MRRAFFLEPFRVGDRAPKGCGYHTQMVGEGFLIAFTAMLLYVSPKIYNYLEQFVKYSSNTINRWGM